MNRFGVNSLAPIYLIRVIARGIDTLVEQKV